MKESPADRDPALSKVFLMREKAAEIETRDSFPFRTMQLQIRFKKQKQSGFVPLRMESVHRTALSISVPNALIQEVGMNGIMMYRIDSIVTRTMRRIPVIVAESQSIISEMQGDREWQKTKPSQQKAASHHS
ncbi:MAG TPA: hypothetical protein VLY03_03810 [Bacteroidota bacterium]|nr:hypothetical protein [Bacteroidota bacterium]